MTAIENSNAVYLSLPALHLKSRTTSLILGELVFIDFSLVLRTAKAPEGNREILSMACLRDFWTGFFFNKLKLKVVGVFLLVNVFGFGFKFWVF